MFKKFLAGAVLLFAVAITGCDSGSDSDTTQIGSTDISGTWDIYWDDETTTYENFVFVQTGSSLTGTWHDEDDENYNITGTIAANVVNVDVPYPDIEQWHLQGTVSSDGNTITGTVAVQGAGSYDGTYQVHLTRRN